MSSNCGHDHSGDIAKLVAIWKMTVAYAGSRVDDFTEYCHANGIKIPRDVVGDDLMYAFQLTSGLGSVALEEHAKALSTDMELDLTNLLRGL